jgi:hypothetical protein
MQWTRNSDGILTFGASCAKIHARRNPTKAPMQSCIAYGLEYDWRQNEGLMLAATQTDE